MLPFLLLIAISAFAVQAGEPDPLHIKGGAVYLSELAKAIQQAGKIVVTEHSRPEDMYDVRAGKSLVPQEIVYATRTLTPEQRQAFAAKVASLDPKSKTTYSKCGPEAHHSIYFYDQDKVNSTMEVCFLCDDVGWSGTKAEPPASLITGLGSFIKEIGLTPKRDWEALAQERSAK